MANTMKKIQADQAAPTFTILAQYIRTEALE